MVRRVVFKTRPVVDVRCSPRVVVAVLQKRIVVLDAATFNNRFVIRSTYYYMPCVESVGFVSMYGNLSFIERFLLCSEYEKVSLTVYICIILLYITCSTICFI